MMVASLGASLQRTGVGATRGLRNRKRDPPLSCENWTRDRLQQCFGAELHDWREPDPVRRQVGKHDAGSKPMQFLCEGHAVVRIGVLSVAAESSGKPTPSRPCRAATSNSESGKVPAASQASRLGSISLVTKSRNRARHCACASFMNGEGGRRPSKSSTLADGEILCIDEPRTCAVESVQFSK